LHLWTERYIKGWQKAHQQGLMIHSSIVQRRATRERQPD
jgi:hypothetical protein